MRRGHRELRVAANRASIGALDQKLSRPEVGVERERIDSESILEPILLNSLSFFSVVKKENELKAQSTVLKIGVLHLGRQHFQHSISSSPSSSSLCEYLTPFQPCQTAATLGWSRRSYRAATTSATPPP
ncbi:hypothetical protein PIB30_046990 [Stylosanthes scabra]|uniref:Uncharacterized protein n=1 Tax=Stylosanthes scabra TaxID=79078 RepID=A0ABU6WEZ6_9FABA|nr:hypothetical protein [Stylosanthes scabra]